MMNFRLLGPLEVIGPDGPVRIRSARERTLLAVLLLASNRAVPVCRLVESLWGDEPPATARSQVQFCVSILRRKLDWSEDIIIVSQPSGYLIRVPDETVDFRRFELYISRARGAEAAGRTHDAVQLMREGLALWRGSAVSDIESRAVDAVAIRLDETRSSVLEACLDLELELGRHRELIGELTELVAAHPLRERLTARLMLALYRSGRQADALATFRQTREALKEELGLDPGEELRELETAILKQESSPGSSRGRRPFNWTHYANAAATASRDT